MKSITSSYKIFPLLILVVFCKRADGSFLKHYDRTNGLNSDLTKGLAFDKLGYLWIGTENGIDRFDGANFNHYDIYNISSRFSKDNRVVSLIPLIDGSVLGIANDGTTFRVIGDTLQEFNIPPEIYKHLSSLNISQDAETLFQLNDVCRYYKDQLITQTKKGSYEIQDKVGKTIKPFHYPVPPDLNAFTRTFNLGPDLIYLDDQFNLWKYKDDNWIKIQSLKNIFDIKSYKIETVKIIVNRLDPNIYITCGSEIIVLIKSKLKEEFSSFKVQINDLSSPIKSIVYSDKYKSLCIGTFFEGVYLFLEQSNSTDIIYKIESERGLILLDSSTILSSSFKLIKQNNIYNIKEYDSQNKTNAFVKDRLGRIIYYYGKEQPELQRMYWSKDSKIKRIEKYRIPDKEYPKFILEDDLNRIWVFFSLNGTVIYDNPEHGPMKEIMRFTEINSVKKALIQKSKIIAFNNQKVIFLIDPIQLTYTSKELENDAYLIRDAFPIATDSFILATYGYGIFVYLNGKTVNIPNDRNNALKHSHCINFIDGHYIISTNSGLITFNKNDLINFINKRTPIKFNLISHFNEFKNEFNGECSPCSQTKDGHILYPHIQGIADIDIRSHLNNKNSTFLFKLDSFAVDLGHFQYVNHEKKVFEMNGNGHAIRFKTSTIYWADRSNLYIRAFITNGEYNFDTIFHHSEIVFNKLPSGLNIIKLVLYNSDNPERSINLIVLVPEKFYEKWSFWILVSMAFVSITLLIMYLYGYVLKRRNKLLKQKIIEATHELNDLVEKISRDKESLENASVFNNKIITVITHDVLGPLSTTNLLLEHMIKNAHNQIEFTQLSEIRRSNELITRQAFEILTWSKARNNNFKPFLQKFDLCEILTDAIDLFKILANQKHMIVKNEIPTHSGIRSDKSIVRIVLSNIMENSVKYGESLIKINLDEEPSMTLITFTNDGPGFDPKYIELFNNNDLSQTLYHVYNPEKGGYGLRICKELIQILGGDIEIRSSNNEHSVIIRIPNPNNN